LHERIEETGAASVTALFFDLFEAAEGYAGAAGGVVRREASCQIFFCFVFKVDAEFLIQFRSEKALTRAPLTLLQER